MKDRRGKTIAFLSAIIALMGAIVIIQANAIDDRKEMTVKWLCDLQSLDYKSSSYDVKKKLYRVECQ